MGIIFGKIDVEKARYDIVKKIGNYEVRKYHPAVAVQTTAPDVKTDNRSFGKLARYIGVFGTPENKARGGEGGDAAGKVAMTAPVVSREAVAMTAPVVSREAVAMTAPVVSKEQGADSKKAMVMQFILPAKYTMETAPVPTGPGVELVELPARTYVVEQYSGRTTMADGKKRLQAMLAELAKSDPPIKVDEADFELYRYNPPFTLSFLRTNEIAVRVVEDE
eukprot:g5059.t1